ncbi:MAG: hypothetical protein EBZ59_06670 [Planctomycetia bacterium]|nr:hypothetical protein [Planctomycetia bacterium]
MSRTNAMNVPASLDALSACGCSRAARLTLSLALLCVAGVATAPLADAQVVVYETFRPVAAVPVAVAPAYGSYVANYTPTGNYAAVTAFSPPVMTAGMPAVAAPVAVTTAFAPAGGYAAMPSYAMPSYAPVTASYAPVTAYYAPSVVQPTVVAPVAAPVTAYYAPAAMQVYRRGLFGVYRPVPAAYVAPY